MIKLFLSLVVFAGVSGIALQPALVAQTNQLAPFQEVYGLLRSNLPSLTEQELNAAAVEGLVSRLKGRALLVSDPRAQTNAPPAGGVLVRKPALFDKNFGYLGIDQMAEGLGKAFDAAYDSLAATNKLKGLVLDLRFTTGRDYEAMADVASRFVEKGRLLAKLSGTSVESSDRGKGIPLPLTILVNSETAGSAEVLAAVLNESKAALIIGNNTAGNAHSYRDFPLSDGRTLKIATGAIELANGKTLSARGVVPDIAVTVSTQAERAYLDDPYRINARPGAPPSTLVQIPGVAHRRRLNEAELVRMRRESDDPADLPGTPASEPAKPAITDPVLGRAVDILKGMAAFQRRQ
ncbi:MAG: hypothetical protein EXS31_11955 [Pedosphaera sp.]|nr:hypothetical protein [Pedosphaera sp.]